MAASIRFHLRWRDSSSKRFQSRFCAEETWHLSFVWGDNGHSRSDAP